MKSKMIKAIFVGVGAFLALSFLSVKMGYCVPESRGLIPDFGCLVPFSQFETWVTAIIAFFIGRWYYARSR